MEQGAGSLGGGGKEQRAGAGSFKRRAFRLSIIRSRLSVDKGEQNYRTSGRRTRRAAVLGYPIYEQEQQLEMIGG